MLRLRNIVLVCLPLLLIGARAEAAIINLVANLTHAAETTGGTPLVTSPGGAPRPLSFGTAHFVLDTTLLFMTMSVDIFNIDINGTQTPGDSNDNLTAAHIHAGAAASPTTNVGVVWGFFGAPQNDIAPNDRTVTPFASVVGGTFTGKWDALEGNLTNLAAQIPFLLTEHAYINFHTRQFPGGEIRGFLQVVPEPATLALMALGLAGLARVRRRFA